MLRRGSREFGVPDCGLVAQVVVQAFDEAPTNSETTKRKQSKIEIRSAFMMRTVDTDGLLHGRKIGRMHVHLVHSKDFAHFVYKGLGSLDVRLKHRVGMKCIPVFLRSF